MRFQRVAILLPLLVLTLLTAACTDSAAATLEVAPDAEFFIEDGDGRTAIATRAEVEDALPFTLALPSNVPDGMRLRVLTAHVAPDRAPPDLARTLAKATANIASADRARSFLFNQQAHPSGVPVGLDSQPGDPGVRRQVTVGGQPASLMTSNAEGNRPALLALLWIGCDSRFQLTASPENLTETEALEIAESTVEACQ